MRVYRQWIGLIVALFGLSGCFAPTPSGPVAPPTPPTTSQDIPQSPLGNLDPNAEYGQHVSGGTPQLDRPLTSYEKLSMHPAQKKKYEELQAKQEKNKQLIKEAEMERIGADLEIIKVLKGTAGVNDQLDSTPSVAKMSDEPVDPLEQLKHLEWVKEKADIEADGLKKEVAKIEQEMDKILNEASRSCFPPGTQIVMDDGSFKAIDAIVAGERVMVYDIGKEQISTATVSHTWEDVNNHFYILNDTIYATAYERFLTHEGWKKIRDIGIGEAIFNGNHYTVVERKDKIAAQTPVYNLTITKSHNFFILPSAHEPILVHNTPGGGSGGGGGGGK
ncbi:MAG: hypothetical protein IBX45_01445 [Campylobacterales bacterium]|nr:hypothetical protein [Campylobacterales bacterium]